MGGPLVINPPSTRESDYYINELYKKNCKFKRYHIPITLWVSANLNVKTNFVKIINRHFLHCVSVFSVNIAIYAFLVMFLHIIIY